MASPDLQAVVLCGGRGTRLGAISEKIPKALRLVGAEPFLDRLLESLQAGGVRRAHLCLGHLAHRIREHLAACPPYSLKISVSVEYTPRGTAGALRHGVQQFDDVFLLLMGDTYLDIDYMQVANSLPPDSEAMMVVTSKPCGVGPNVEVSEERVTRYDKAGLSWGWTDTGVAVIRRRVIETLPSGDKPLDLGSVFGSLIAGRLLAAWTIDEPFYDIGTDDRIRRFDEALAKKVHQ